MIETLVTSGAISIEYKSARKLKRIIFRKPAILALNHIIESTKNKYTVRILE